MGANPAPAICEECAEPPLSETRERTYHLPMPLKGSLAIRARDQDRVAACAALDLALAEGQIGAEEHSSRIALATDAATLADLHYLIDDLQGETDLAPIASPGAAVASLSRRGRPSVVGALVRWGVLVAVGAVIFVGVRACASDESATGTYGPAGYLEPRAMDEIVASTEALLGTTVVDELMFYPEYALLSVPSPDNPGREQRYQYRDGEWRQSDDTDRDRGTATVDLADLGPGVLGGLVLGAGASLNIDRIDSMYLFLRADESGPSISLYASDEGANEDGRFDATLSGDFLRVYPFDPAK